jgi:eukaryotic-like serine/threonine-protein kinase
VSQDADPRIIDACPSCGKGVDVTDEIPFAQIYCPHCGEGMKARRMFNNFELIELIGEGGMGWVFKAYDHTLKRMVALKLLRPEMSAGQAERAQLEQEARITASVTHPHVVRIYSFGQAGGQFYIAMELVEKGSLDDLMAIQSRVSEVQVLDIGMQIAQGLDAALDRGLIHRDVKPGNILFANAHTTKIVDFGLARVLEEEAEARGDIWGTPYYIAPERLNHEPEDVRSDIYSLGATLFHAIAGRPPFEAESASLVALKQIKSQPVSLEAFAPDVTPETAYVINRTLEKKPEDRYASYAELIEHMEFAKAKVVERAGRPQAAKREVVKVETSRTKLIVGLISLAAALLILGTLVALFLTSERSEVKEIRDSLIGQKKSGDFMAGMNALGEGSYDMAKGLFEAVAAKPETSASDRQWARMNAAIATMLAGRPEDAMEGWRSLRAEGLFSDDRKDSALANMFVDAGDFGIRKKVIKVEDLTGFPKVGPGAFLFFVAGVKNLSLQDKIEATRQFNEFLEAPEPTEIPWWGTYRILAERLASGG